MDCNKQIDYILVIKIYGEEFASILKDLDVIEVTDTNKYISKYRTKPCVSSIWIFGDGGSYNFHHSIHGFVTIQNGNLSSINGKSIIFGNDYIDQSTQFASYKTYTI